MTVYIPSYFKNYQQRKDLFQLMVESYLNLGYNLIIYWMNKEDEKIIDDRIRYIDSEEIVNASIARNFLLNIFYDSEEEECILSDDDVILNDIYEIKDLKFDVLSLVNDKREKIFETPFIHSTVLIIKNLNKLYNKKIFFDETLDANQDYDFGINLVKNGCKVITLNTEQIIINKNKSVMFDNQMQRLYKKNETLQKIIKKWGLDKYGEFNYKKDL
jgi:hypothetical protein